MSSKQKAATSMHPADITESSSSLARLEELLVKQADIQQKQFQNQQPDFQKFLATQSARKESMLNDMMGNFQHRLAQISLNADAPHNDHEIQDFYDDASEIRSNMNNPPRDNQNGAPPRQ